MTPEEEKQREAENDLDFDYEDDEDNDPTPDYYYCNCCGHDCARRPAWGGECPKCGNVMEEGYF